MFYVVQGQKDDKKYAASQGHIFLGEAAANAERDLATSIWTDRTFTLLRYETRRAAEQAAKNLNAYGHPDGPQRPDPMLFDGIAEWLFWARVAAECVGQMFYDEEEA